MKEKLIVTAMFISLLVQSVAAQQNSRATSKSPDAKTAKAKVAAKKATDALIQIGPSIAPEEIAGKLTKGKTTMDELMALIPKPDNVAMLPDGGRMVTCLWRKAFPLPDGRVFTREQLLSSLPGPFVLFGLPGNRKKMREAIAQAEAVQSSMVTLTMMFNSAGVMKDFQFSPPIVSEAPVATVQTQSLATTTTAPQ